MATKLWVSTDGNWATAASWNPVNAPVDNDVVIFGTASNVSVTAGLDQAGVDLDALITLPTYLGHIGTSVGPLQCTADKVTIEGAGNFYFASNLGSGAEKTDVVIVKAASPNAIIELGSMTGEAGEINYIYLARGNVTLTNVTGVNELEIGYLTNPGSDCRCTIQSGVGTIARASIHGAYCTCSAVITTLLAGGSAQWIQADTATITNLLASGAAIIDYNFAGTIAYASMRDRSQLDLTKSGGVKTITQWVLMDLSKVIFLNDPNVHVIPSTQGLNNDLRLVR